MSGELVTLITCTGARPKAFKLCQEYMLRQTFDGDVQWIIVDDTQWPHDVKVKDKWVTEKLRGPKIWEEGLNTQRSNMEEALSKVKGDYILVIEDDDWYHPEYIEKTVNLLKFFQIVGESNNKYWNLRVPGFMEMRNYGHSSLCSTAVRQDSFNYLKRAVNSGHFYFDIELWKYAKEDKLKTCMYSELNLCIGIKGMPGRGGLGVGHQDKAYTPDIKLLHLKKWIGDDYKNYIPFMPRNIKPDEVTNAANS